MWQEMCVCIQIMCSLIKDNVYRYISKKCVSKYSATVLKTFTELQKFGPWDEIYQ